MMMQNKVILYTNTINMLFLWTSHSFVHPARVEYCYVEVVSVESPTQTKPLVTGHILLLYARDCQPFMELMATFRECLEEWTGCEVWDCFDSTRWLDIGTDPTSWLHRLLDRPDTRVVLVATQCAHLRQQAYLGGAEVGYLVPQAYDRLFLTAVKNLTDHETRDVYKKVCVVRFDGFADDGDLFRRLTPYTRYVLPAHMNEFVDQLQPRVRDIQDVTKQEESLCHDLTRLVYFQKNNANYLKDILMVQRRV